MVTVLMPAYNAERFLVAAIESVLQQTYRHFEIIVVDDGSSDRTRSIAESYPQKDPRVRVVSQTNQGAANALNHGLQLARYEMVAIMHADDVMFPNRLEQQLAFLQKNPEVAALSSLVYNIDSNGRVIARGTSSLTTKEAARTAQERGEIVAVHHPAVMLRKSVVLEAGMYRQQFVPAEDVDLWSRIMERGHLVMVLPEFLLSYRIHGNSASVSNAWEVTRKVRWVKVCAKMRRNQQPEPNWEDFLKYQKSRPWPQKINENRKDAAKILYKRAVECYAAKRHGRMALPLVVATALQPIYVFRQLTGKFLAVESSRPARRSPS